MIQIEDNDMPIIVAKKLITGTMQSTSKFMNAIGKIANGSDIVDMYTRDELKEIADYLYVYVNSHNDWE